MKIELGTHSVAAKLHPLIKAGWKATLQTDATCVYLMLHSADGTMMITICGEEDACLYLPPRKGDGILFEGSSAIDEAVAAALSTTKEAA